MLQYFGIFLYLIHNEQIKVHGNKLKYFFISMYFNLLYIIKIYRTIILKTTTLI
jgi:hypothetical protein